MTRAIENHWVFGRGSHLEFLNGLEPISLLPSSIATDEGSASISDNNGNLLFYTDGVTLWDSNNLIITSGLGGHISSTQSVLIIPPVGNGNIYHIFTVADMTNPSDLNHTSFLISNDIITQQSQTIGVLNKLVSERVTAISKNNCDGYWVVTQELDSNDFYVLSVDNSGINTVTVNTTIGPIQSAFEPGYMKFSPDGSILVYADTYSNNIVIYDFSLLTGTISYNRIIDNINVPYGLEFSPNSQFFYYSCSDTTILTRLIYQYNLNDNTQILIDQNITSADKHFALQLGPNDKIYCAELTLNTLSVIENPNSLGSSCGFLQVALDRNGDEIVFNNINWIGLPNFVRLSDNCQSVSETSVCETLLSEVNETLSEQTSDYENTMEHCDGSKGDLPRSRNCDTLELPEIKPTYNITYGDSYCDCVESDDIETMTITICNPYNNMSLDNVVISSLVLVDENGDPVAILPKGQASGEIVPIGPYCFGTIDSCSCISREFSFRSRGMIAGKYKIIAKGICFDVNIHQDDQACFIFDICKD